MKKNLMILSMLGAFLAAPIQSQAWVSYHGASWGGGGYSHVSYGHVGWGGTTYHTGWSCGGVSTGTAVAAGVAGLAAGAMIGSAVASKPTVVVAPAVYAAPAPVYVTPAPVYVAPAIPIGSIYYSLPYGAQSANINGTQYYVSNGVYYRPYFGSNGVYYQVAPNPI